MRSSLAVRPVLASEKGRLQVVLRAGAKFTIFVAPDSSSSVSTDPSAIHPTSVTPSYPDAVVNSDYEPTPGLRKLEPEYVLPKPSAPREPDFSNQLWGENTLELFVQAMLRRNVVLGAYSETHVLHSIGEGTPFVNAQKWRQVFSNVETINLGKGAYNIATTSDVEDTPLLLRLIFGTAYRNQDIVHRRTNPFGSATFPTASEAMMEFIITGYAALMRVGPLLYAAMMTPVEDLDVEENEDELEKERQVAFEEEAAALRPSALSAFDGDVPLPSSRLKQLGGSLLDTSVRIDVFTERWNGDLNTKLARREFEPKQFATLLSALLGRAADAGIVHLDLKPPNMLYRGKGQMLEICFTDFDQTFCTIWPSNLRQEYKKCNILIHVTMLLGYISCVMGSQTWEFYRPAVVDALVADHQIDKGMYPDYLCEFLDSVVRSARSTRKRRIGDDVPLDRVVEEFRTRTRGEDYKPLNWLAENWRRSMEWYLQYGGKGDARPKDTNVYRCLLKENNERPLFWQFAMWALNKPNPEYEVWSKPPPRSLPQQRVVLVDSP